MYNFRATLIVTPTSVLSQWVGQIEEHVSKNVDIEIFVHHGTSKAIIKSELEDKDIVFTTYGTLQAEFHELNPGPLLKAQW